MPAKCDGNARKKVSQSWTKQTFLIHSNPRQVDFEDETWSSVQERAEPHSPGRRPQSLQQTAEPRDLSAELAQLRTEKRVLEGRLHLLQELLTQQQAEETGSHLPEPESLGTLALSFRCGGLSRLSSAEPHDCVGERRSGGHRRTLEAAPV